MGVDRLNSAQLLLVDRTDLAAGSFGTPDPVRDFDTKRPKADENGEPLFAVQLVALADGGAEILTVKIAGEPNGLHQGVPVK